MITERIDYGIQLSHCNCNKIYVIYLFCINGLIRFKTILKLDKKLIYLHSWHNGLLQTKVMLANNDS